MFNAVFCFLPRTSRVCWTDRISSGIEIWNKGGNKTSQSRILQEVQNFKSGCTNLKGLQYSVVWLLVLPGLMAHLTDVLPGVLLRDVPDHQTVHPVMLLDADPGIGVDDDVTRGQDVVASSPDDVSPIWKVPSQFPVDCQAWSLTEVFDQAVELGGLTGSLADLGRLSEYGRGEGGLVGGHRQLWGDNVIVQLGI